MNRIAALLFLLAAGCLARLTPGADFTPAEPPPDLAQSGEAPLRIFILDVGQGDSTLIVTPSLQTILIDAGKPGMGLDAVLPFLEESALDRLDAVFVSHYDADHVGGVSEVLKGRDQELGTDDDWSPAFVADRGGATDDPIFLDYRETIGNARRTVRPGEIFELGDGLSAECVIVNGETAFGNPVELKDADENAKSMGLLFRYGDFTYFTAGDLPGGGRGTPDLEAIIAPQIGFVDLLHLSHHGSETSSSLAFLQTLAPKAALMSVGNHNGYGHPHPSVLARLNATGIPLYQTREGDGGFLPSSHIQNGLIEVTVKRDGSFEISE